MTDKQPFELSVKSLLCITEGLSLDHGRGLVMRQIEDSLVIFKPNEI